LIGLAVVAWSVKLILKKTNIKNICIAVIILFLLGFSQWILVEIFFFGAWPTFIPHVATGISILLVILQFFVTGKVNKQQESHTTADKV
jgi:hypothetical protein